jgi:hypothetical protein
MGKTYEELQEEVTAGTPGNQALWALYRPNNRGVWERIRHAEGNQVSYEAQTAERNYMDQRQSSTEVTGYKKSLEKTIVIEKGDSDYEYFNDYQIHEYKGKDALLDLLEVDLMHSERGGSALWYIARKTKMTVTVTSLDATEGTLSASFSQYGDTEHGIAACLTADPDAPTFKSEKEIAPVMADIDPVSLKVGETATVPVSFTSFGTRKDRFDVSVSSGADKVKAERLRDSVVVTGLAATASQTPAAVTVTSVQGGGASKTIAVAVTAP